MKGRGGKMKIKYLVLLGVVSCIIAGCNHDKTIIDLDNTTEQVSITDDLAADTIPPSLEAESMDSLEENDFKSADGNASISTSSEPIINTSDNQHKPHDNLNTSDLIDSTSELQKNNFNEYHPIIFLWGGDEEGWYSSGYVLGGYKDGEWYSVADFEYDYPTDEYFSDEIIANTDLIKNQDFFKIYSQAGYLDCVTIGEPTYRVSMSTLDGYLKVDFEPIYSEANIMIGINSDSDIVFNPITVLDEYTYEVDINNNGTKDVITIEKTSITEGDSELIRDIKIIANIDKNDIVFYDANEIYLADFELLVIDVNDDGIPEIITYMGTYYGFWFNVYAYNEASYNQVLHFYSGD
jgi:hypothetical protein